VKIDFFGFELLNKKEIASVKKTIKSTINASKLRGYYIVISLVDDSTMLDLQKNYKKKAFITDVLSFPVPKEERNFLHTKNMLGDIVISLSKAQEQANTHGHSLLEELVVLSVHGFFHLLGYDHERSKDEALQQMQGEMWLLDCIGFNSNLSLIGRV
jgi:probable rRNA maturation factor